MADEVEVKLRIQAINETKSATEDMLRTARKGSQDLGDITESQWRAFAARAKDGTKTVDELLTNYFNRYKEGTKIVEAHGKATQDANRRVKESIHEVGKVADNVGGPGGPVNNFNKAVLDGAGAAAGALGRYALGYLTVAKAISVAKQSYSEFADYQRTMQLLKFDANATDQQVEDLTRTLDRVNKLTGEGAQEVRRNFTEMHEALGIHDIDQANKLFEKIGRAAAASSVPIEIMRTAFQQASINLKLSGEQAEELLDRWTAEIPNSMKGAWAAVAPGITSSMKAIGLTGAEAGSDIARSFAQLTAQLGSAEAAAQTLNALMVKGRDPTSLFGKMMIPRLQEIQQLPKEDQAEATKKAGYEIVKLTGYYQSQDLFFKGLIERKLGMNAQELEGIKLLGEAEKKHTATLKGEVDKRIEIFENQARGEADAAAAAIDVGKRKGGKGVSGVIAPVLKGIGAIPQLMEEREDYEELTKNWNEERKQSELAALRKELSGIREKKRSGQPLSKELAERERVINSQIEMLSYDPAWRLKEFAKGTDFLVPGTGGTDDVPIDFKATPGERVIVQPKADVTRESMQRQSDKADQALRDHFSRFHDRDSKRKSADSLMASLGPWGAKYGSEAAGGAGGGGAGRPGGGGRPGGTGTGTDGTTTGTDGGLKTPVGLDETSPTGPAETVEEAVRRGYLPGATTEGGGAAGFLAAKRAGFAKELQNPETRRLLGAIISSENIGAGPAVAESLMNRTEFINEQRKAQGKGPLSLRDMMGKFGDSFYGPIKKGYIQEHLEKMKNPAFAARMNKLIDQALSGSNVILSHTDQGSKGDPNYEAGGIGVNINGERFNDWLAGKGTRAWRERRQAAVDAAARAGGTAVTTPGAMTTGGIGAALRGEPVAAGGGSVEEAQGRVAGTRKQPLDPQLRDALELAAERTGVKVSVTSGGQPTSGPNRVGSHRHDLGRAADLDLVDPKTGKILELNDPRRLKFLEEAAAAGAGGTGTQYMSDPRKMHVGITGAAAKVGEGLGAYAGTPEEREAVARGLRRKMTPQQVTEALRKAREAAAGPAPPAVAPGGYTPGPVEPGSKFDRPAAVAAYGGLGQQVYDPITGRPKADTAGAPSPLASLAPLATDVPQGQLPSMRRARFGRPERPEPSAHLAAYHEHLQKIREDAEKPIEPVIRPKVEHMGVSRQRWNRVIERRRELDSSRDQARLAQADTGFA
jgi:hypothetical protein